MRHAILCAAVFFLSSFVLPQAPNAERPRCIFFSNFDRAETEQKINDYAAQGYRLVGLQVNLTKAFVVALEDQGGPQHEYKLLAGHWQHVIHDDRPMIKQVNDLASQGYRIFRGSLLFMHPDSPAGEVNELGLVMERAVGASDRFEYRESRTVMLSNAKKDLQAALHDGFEPVLTYSHPGGQPIMVFEKGSATEKKFDPGAPGARNSKAVLNSIFNPMTINGSIAGEGFAIRNMKPKTVRAELAVETSKGMHPLTISSGGYPCRVETVLAEVPSAKPARILVVEGKGRKSDQDWQVAEWKTVEEQLNAAAGEGYVVSLRPVFAAEANFGLTQLTERVVIPMEKSDGPKLRYKIVEANSLPLLSEMTNKAEADGWRVIPGYIYGDHMLFLQQEAAQ